MEFAQESEGTTLEKLEIIGTEEELRRLAFSLMDAIDVGKVEVDLDGGGKLTLRSSEHRPV